MMKKAADVEAGPPYARSTAPAPTA